MHGDAFSPEVRVGVALKAGLRAKLEFGPPLFSSARIGVGNVSTGLDAQLNVASASVQASDDTYSANYGVGIFARAEFGITAGSFWKNFINFSYTQTVGAETRSSLASSPLGTLGELRRINAAPVEAAIEITEGKTFFGAPSIVGFFLLDSNDQKIDLVVQAVGDTYAFEADLEGSAGPYTPFATTKFFGLPVQLGPSADLDSWTFSTSPPPAMLVPGVRYAYNPTIISDTTGPVAGVIVRTYITGWNFSDQAVFDTTGADGVASREPRGGTSALNMDLVSSVFDDGATVGDPISVSVPLVQPNCDSDGNGSLNAICDPATQTCLVDGCYPSGWHECHAGGEVEICEPDEECSTMHGSPLCHSQDKYVCNANSQDKLCSVGQGCVGCGDIAICTLEGYSYDMCPVAQSGLPGAAIVIAACRTNPNYAFEACTSSYTYPCIIRSGTNTDGTPIYGQGNVAAYCSTE